VKGNGSSEYTYKLSIIFVSKISKHR